MDDPHDILLLLVCVCIPPQDKFLYILHGTTFIYEIDASASTITISLHKSMIYFACFWIKLPELLTYPSRVTRDVSESDQHGNGFTYFEDSSSRFHFFLTRSCFHFDSIPRMKSDRIHMKTDQNILEIHLHSRCHPISNPTFCH